MKVRINDVELEVGQGTSVMDAIFAAGYDVPYFCSQEYLSPIGACRMCLARIGAPRKGRDGNWILDEETGDRKIFTFPNMMATCTTQVMEGMVVDTLSEDVKRIQNGMVEFTLINHPLDCPVCDKGGACELQDRAYEYGTGRSRFVFDKRHQEKHHPLSELITLDRERCIHCKRCVRYFEEVPGDSVLDFIERGGHTYIGTLDDGLPSNFSGNITDICPVGALLDATSRFRGRNWEYQHTRSTGMDDASGSAITIDGRTGRIERIRAALHPDVNKTWIDDGTRFGHEYVDAGERLRSPLLRRDGELQAVTWQEAAAFVRDRLSGLSGKDIGIALRADATLEEGIAAKALAAALDTGQLDHAPRPAAAVIPPQNPATLTDLATAAAILVVGDVTEEVPIVDLRIKDALKGVTPPQPLAHGVPIADLRLKEHPVVQRDKLSVAAPYRVELMKHAGRALRYPAGGEVALFQALQAVAEAEGEPELDDGGRAALGTSMADAAALVEQLREADNAVLVFGGFVLATRAATAAANTFAKTVGAKVLILGPMADSYGLELIGVTPSHERYAYPDMLGGARALILSNLDPAQDPDVRALLEQKDFLVVHDLFLTATAELADVVLPATSVYEKDGTTVNLEGRVLGVHAAPVDAGEAEDFVGLVGALGEAMARRLEGRSLRSAQRVLRKRFQFDPAELEPWGRLYRPKSRSGAKVAIRSREAVEGDVLVTPSMLRIEYLQRNPHLLRRSGGAQLRMHPGDAAGHGVAAGDAVRLRVGGLLRRATVRLDESLPPGLMLLPTLPEQPIGLARADLSTLVREERELEVAG